MKTEQASAEVQGTADMILSQTERISRIVRTLIDFSRSGDNSDHTAVSLRSTVADAIQLLQLDKSAKAVAFENRVPDDVLVRGDSHQLTQVFVNLLANARDASAAQGEILITCEIAGDRTPVVRVVDSGSGIPAQLLDKVMEPFFTTKEPGEGTGLGLSLVYSIIRLHRGSIEITSPVSDNRGTCVTIRLIPA